MRKIKSEPLLVKGSACLAFALILAFSSCAVEKNNSTNNPKYQESQKIFVRSESKLKSLGCNFEDDSADTYLAIHINCTEPSNLFQIIALRDLLRDYAKNRDNFDALETDAKLKAKSQLKRDEALREVDILGQRIEALNLKKAQFEACLADLLEVGFMLDTIPARFRRIADADELDLVRVRFDALAALITIKANDQSKDIEKCVEPERLARVRANLTIGNDYYQKQQKSLNSGG